MQKRLSLNDMFLTTKPITLYKHIPTLSTAPTSVYPSLKTGPKQTSLLTFYDNTLKTLYLTFDKQHQQRSQNLALSPQQSGSPCVMSSKCNLALFKEPIQAKHGQQSELNVNVNDKQQPTHLMKLKKKFDSFYNEVTNTDSNNHLLNGEKEPICS